jgi:negative regulator of flagellin synthesis FlgM
VSQVNKNKQESEQDRLAVSQNGQIFQRLVQKAKELSDIRQDKVQTISEQIARGEFRLDADSIAASMLSAQDTGGK